MCAYVMVRLVMVNMRNRFRVLQTVVLSVPASTSCTHSSTISYSVCHHTYYNITTNKENILKLNNYVVKPTADLIVTTATIKFY